jgi:hypothetical protein
VNPRRSASFVVAGLIMGLGALLINLQSARGTSSVSASSGEATLVTPAAEDIWGAGCFSCCKFTDCPWPNCRFCMEELVPNPTFYIQWSTIQKGCFCTVSLNPLDECTKNVLITCATGATKFDHTGIPCTVNPRAANEVCTHERCAAGSTTCLFGGNCP